MFFQPPDPNLRNLALESSVLKVYCCPGHVHPEVKNSDIQNPSLCFAASLCLFALLFSSLGLLAAVLMSRL